MSKSPPQDELLEIAPHLIVQNPNQPRRHFDKEELLDLAQSIKNLGIIHPPVVRPVSSGLYEIISGERRVRAAQLAGFKKIPVLIRHTTSPLSARAALIENIQRVDLNPIEIAKALKKLVEEFKLPQELLALEIGKKRSTVANYLRLLTLPQSIQENVTTGKISMGHAKAILYLDGAIYQNKLLEKILKDDLTVRQTEKMAKGMGKKEKKPLSKDIHMEELIQKLQNKLGTKVVFSGRGRRGKITIDYYDYDDLDRLLSFFGV
jgi:ParB family chromosome partitioning protein